MSPIIPLRGKFEDKKPYPDLEDAAQTHAVCIAADLSAELGKPVTIRELENLV